MSAFHSYIKALENVRRRGTGKYLADERWHAMSPKQKAFFETFSWELSPVPLTKLPLEDPG